VIQKHIAELNQERNQVASQQVIKGEKAEYKAERNFDVISKEIDIAEKDLRELGTVILTGNLNAYVMWDGDSIPVSEAIELAKNLRSKAALYANFGRAKDNEIDKYASTPQSTVIKVLNYNPQTYADLAKKLLRQAQNLSTLIDDADDLMVDYPNYNVYMD
jgi:hypothetical protein